MNMGGVPREATGRFESFNKEGKKRNHLRVF